MNTPKTSLPFFAYGLLKPGQPAFFQIREYVDEATYEIACAPGVLVIQDALPILKKTDNNGATKGVLVPFKAESADEAYKTIRAFEPESIYQWDTEDVPGRRANVLYAAHPEAGNPIDWPNWDGWKDPLFKGALKVDEETRRQASEKHGYYRLFRLQMAYLLLWSAIERYLTFRYSAAGPIEKRVKKLSTRKGFR